MPDESRSINITQPCPEIVIPHDACRYLGQYCYADTVSNFLCMTERQFISHMKQAFPRVTSYPLEKKEVESWKRSYRLIRNAFKDAPNFSGATVVFEYVLPAGKCKTKELFREQIGCRADVIILTKTMITVVEVKDRTMADAIDANFHNQAKKYKRRLRRYHMASQDTKVKLMLVCLQEENLSVREKRTWFLSSDGFREKVHSQSIGTQSLAKPDFWISSDWIWR